MKRKTTKGLTRETAHSTRCDVWEKDHTVQSRGCIRELSIESEMQPNEERHFLVCNQNDNCIYGKINLNVSDLNRKVSFKYALAIFILIAPCGSREL